jgi:hypothetical protein
MNIKVKINRDDVKELSAHVNRVYRLDKLVAYYKERYHQNLEIGFDAEFGDDNCIYLFMGDIDQRNQDTIKVNGHKIFDLSSPYQLNVGDFNFIGICKRFHYLRNEPLLYVKKEILTNFQQDVRVHLLGNPDYGYVTIQPTKPIGMLEFLFDYLEAVVAIRTPST